MAYIERRAGGWRAQIRRKGWQPVSKTFRTKVAAERWAREVETGMDTRVWIEAEKTAPLTLRDLLQRYLQDISTTKKGHKDEAYRLRRFINSELGLVTLDRLTPTMIASWRDKRLKQVSGPTVRKDLSILSNAISIGMKEWGVGIGVNPVSQISKPPPNRPRDRRLTEAEFGQLFGAFETCRNQWIKPVVVFALETAMRRGEILSLKWDDTNQDKRVAFLPETKNGDCRSVPLSSAALRVLSDLPRYSERVFDTTPDSLRMSFDRAVVRANILNYRFHDLRHEATSRFFELGLNIMEVSAITGHKDLSMLKRYTHLKAEDLAMKLN